MRFLVFVPILLPVAAALSGCASVSPQPERARAADLPHREVSDAERVEVGSLVEQAIAAVTARRYEPAAEAAEAALAIDPRAARARSVLGMVLLHRASTHDPADLRLTNQGELETVLAEQLAPEDAFVGWMRAVFLAEIGHMSAAAAAAEAAVARTAAAPPSERAALLGVAGTYRYELGEERAALPLLQAYIALRPDDAAACFRIGRCLLRTAETPLAKELDKAQRDAEAAARAFARCAELAPGDDDAALAVGAASYRAAQIAVRRGDTAARDRLFGAAEQRFRAAAERFPALAEPWFRLAVVAEARGETAAAEAAYGEALQRDERHLGSLLNLASLATTAGDTARTNGLLERVLRVADETGALSQAEHTAIVERLRGAAPTRP